MEKSATLNLRVNPTLKSDARQFSVPKPPADIDVTQMTETQLHAKLQRGYDDYKAGRTHSAAEAFAEFREIHSFLV